LEKLSNIGKKKNQKSKAQRWIRGKLNFKKLKLKAKHTRHLSIFSRISITTRNSQKFEVFTVLAREIAKWNVN